MKAAFPLFFLLRASLTFARYVSLQFFNAPRRGFITRFLVTIYCIFSYIYALSSNALIIQIVK